MPGRLPKHGLLARRSLAALWDHFSAFGEVVVFEIDDKSFTASVGEHPAILDVTAVRVVFASRKDAENALAQGKYFRGHALHLAWGTAVSAGAAASPPLSTLVGTATTVTFDRGTNVAGSRCSGPNQLAIQEGAVATTTALSSRGDESVHATTLQPINQCATKPQKALSDSDGTTRDAADRQPTSVLCGSDVRELLDECPAGGAEAAPHSVFGSTTSISRAGGQVGESVEQESVAQEDAEGPTVTAASGNNPSAFENAHPMSLGSVQRARPGASQCIRITCGSSAETLSGNQALFKTGVQCGLVDIDFGSSEAHSRSGHRAEEPASWNLSGSAQEDGEGIYLAASSLIDDEGLGKSSVAMRNSQLIASCGNDRREGEVSGDANKGESGCEGLGGHHPGEGDEGEQEDGRNDSASAP
ncbi:hypothetical protein CBR_g4666 [Chara braunii]|uniref:RRM domain-containing protein n=1 Tax=Chara braunii TaxID=69332 RepID=A0A388KIJ7_CHABU|nr:hypothetical protein CBR_g4666 [Chara braunii]|eukprot:GBG69838.1 hypothetical protein CBR_g4666 [Chara braunii]